MSDDAQLNWLSAARQAELVRTGEVSPLDLVEASLARLDAVEPTINAFVTVTAELARDDARAKERALRHLAASELPPLFGVPVSIKDLCDTAGVRTTYGAVKFADHIPQADGVNVARLKDAGTISLGKTTTPEFGMLGTTESALTGITNNPWNPDYTAGGSSGGAAASTAAGVTAIAWGSDGGGSIRIPAAVCGLVGLKPSRGRIPVDTPWESAATEGPLARTVLDVALALQVTAGGWRRDPLSLPAQHIDFAEAVRYPRALTGVRIAYAPAPSGLLIAREVSETVDAALRVLEADGAIVDSIELPLPDPVEQCLAFWGAELHAVEEMLGGVPHPAMRQVIDRAPDAATHLAAVTSVRAQISRIYADVLDAYDFLITPTMPVAPFRHPGPHGGATDVDGHPVPVPALYFHLLTDPPTQAGLPAITVPVGWSADGLPIGMQIVGDLFDDRGVLEVAANVERLVPWSTGRPLFA